MVLRAALLCAALFAPPPEQHRLIEAGTFHAGEVSDADAGPWLGLFSDGQRYAWRDAVVDVRAVRDDSVDANDQRTGRMVSVRGGGNPLFLLRGGEDLRVAFVDGYRELELRELHNGDQLKLNLGSQEFVLRVANPHRHGDADMAGSSLELVSNGVTQLLYSAGENANEPAWEILWAGDLDGDGKLDLYLQLGADSSVSERILFVSTMAAAGQLVAEFAVFSTRGS